MSFNNGFICPNCGPVRESKERSINKIKFPTCKACMAVVTTWVRPLNERAGRCRNCAASGFKMAMYKGDLIRNCKKCDEVYNIDTEKVIRQGKEEFKYERAKR